MFFDLILPLLIFPGAQERIEAFSYYGKLLLSKKKLNTRLPRVLNYMSYIYILILSYKYLYKDSTTVANMKTATNWCNHI